MTGTSPPTVPRADFSRVDPAAVALLAERWARRYCVVPLHLEDGALVVATSDPMNLDAERAVAFATGRRVHWTEASPEEISIQLARWYADGLRAESAAPPVEVQHIGFSSTLPAQGSDDAASAIQLVDQLLAEGIQAGASDIHIEPEEEGIAVRHRIDGVLRQARLLARALGPSLSSRVKILSGLDIADRMRPQDGRARVAVRGAVVDLRVSTLPASHGEKIVIRVLDGSAGLRSLDSIGFVDEDLARIRELLQQREGLVLVTGPTGSGKTTTLYAALREVQARGVNVVTVEDPIEYRLPGIVQVQVHERAGLTFGAALRSIMRQDPDVILVGEIRDRETAEIAIQASLTGHLVFSTLHTNDAASAIARLVDIGAASYQIATAVKGVIAQRLVRRLCPACAGAGCRECGESGYRGRRAIAEILLASPEFERRVASGATPESIAEAARANGCVPLWEAGLALVRRGETSIDELRRVAAEPARRVTEPTVPAGSRDGATRIGWWSARSGAVSATIKGQLVAAAAVLGDGVEIVSFDAEHPDGLPVDAIVALGALPPSSGETRGSRFSTTGRVSAPLVVALASDGSASEHVRLLGHDADVVLSTNTHGRVVLATVLALLRWRAR
ncbi:MAG TPA: GspE/PulE family protein [Gemmatimonadaceae bacterium]|nr:GspE/PulE family protein [Gemmatimonadaceae bacterium]